MTSSSCSFNSCPLYLYFWKLIAALPNLHTDIATSSADLLHTTIYKLTTHFTLVNPRQLENKGIVKATYRCYCEVSIMWYWKSIERITRTTMLYYYQKIVNTQFAAHSVMSNSSGKIETRLVLSCQKVFHLSIIHAYYMWKFVSPSNTQVYWWKSYHCFLLHFSLKLLVYFPRSSHISSHFQLVTSYLSHQPVSIFFHHLYSFTISFIQ